MPWTPRKTRSRWTLRRAATANGPTSASDGVRTPPVRMIVWSDRPVSCRTSATWGELVTTVSATTSASRRAIRWVVVPAETPIAVPGSTRPDRRVGDGVLLAQHQGRLRGEARLEQRAPVERRGAAMDLLDEPTVVRGARGRAGSSCPTRRARGRGLPRGPRRPRGRARGCIPGAGALARDPSATRARPGCHHRRRRRPKRFVSPTWSALRVATTLHHRTDTSQRIHARSCAFGNETSMTS